MKSFSISRLFQAHICMLVAEITWGLMAPVGKDAMTHGISGMDMVVFRTVGGAFCFWLTSLLTGNHEHVTRRDKMLFVVAAILAIVTNQCCYIIGLSLTSPINASIVTTSMPIFTLCIGLLFHTERLTWRKVLGLSLGISGALALIMNSAGGQGIGNGNILGDLLCLTAQVSFAFYLALCGRLISRYNTITCMKWMFLFAALITLPIGTPSLMQLPWTEIAPKHWTESAFVVFGGTFFAYIMMMKGQKVLTPTQVSVYNYVQPIVSTMLSMAWGIATLGWMQGVAIALVFAGVQLVARKK